MGLALCATSMAELAEVKRSLGKDGDRLQGLFVTVDPERDTRDVLKTYMANFDPTFLALRGTPEQLAAMAKDYKVYYKKVDGKTPTSYTMDHSAGSYIYDTQGRLRLYFWLFRSFPKLSWRRRMLKVFPQLEDVRIEHAWGGYVDITLNRAPDFGRLEPDVYYLQGFSGHGIALAGLAGKVVAEAIAGSAERFDVFARIPHRQFPGGTLLRRPALVLAMLYYRLKDLL